MEGAENLIAGNGIEVLFCRYVLDAGDMANVVHLHVKPAPRASFSTLPNEIISNIVHHIDKPTALHNLSVAQRGLLRPCRTCIHRTGLINWTLYPGLLKVLFSVSKFFRLLPISSGLSQFGSTRAM